MHIEDRPERIPNTTYLEKEWIGERFNHEYFLGFLGFQYRLRIQGALERFGFIPTGHQLNFYEKAVPHGRNSSALYLIDEPIGEHQVLVSFIPSGGKTSHHLHTAEEWYRKIDGTGELVLEGGKVILQDQTHIVAPLELHQAEARGGWVLVAIRMVGNAEHIPLIEV